MRIIIAVCLLVLLTAPADARRHRYNVRVDVNVETVETAAGTIRIASSLAEQFVALITDLVDMGFDGPVGCYAARGHMRGSRHHVGAACDFAQRSRNVTDSEVMYRAREVIEAHGLRDGCTFRRPDCGHVDDGKPREYAGRHHRKHRLHRRRA